MKPPNFPFVYQPKFVSVFIRYNPRDFNLNSNGMFVRNIKNRTVHINRTNNVKFYEETWVYFWLNEYPFKETIMELIKECFGGLMKPIYTFDESKYLWYTIISSKNTKRVYINFFLQVWLGKGIGVFCLFSVLIIRENHG